MAFNVQGLVPGEETLSEDPIKAILASGANRVSIAGRDPVSIDRRGLIQRFPQLVGDAIGLNAAETIVESRRIAPASTLVFTDTADITEDTRLVQQLAGERVIGVPEGRDVPPNRDPVTATAIRGALPGPMSTQSSQGPNALVLLALAGLAAGAT